MSKIIPITELRNTSNISELCASENEPIFITKNGYGDMVIMSINTYQERIQEFDTYLKLLAGKVQADNKILLNGNEELMKLRNKYVK